MEFKWHFISSEPLGTAQEALALVMSARQHALYTMDRIRETDTMAFLDTPAPWLLDELHAAFPDAAVVLTTRNADDWAMSRKDKHHTDLICREGSIDKIADEGTATDFDPSATVDSTALLDALRTATDGDSGNSAGPGLSWPPSLSTSEFSFVASVTLTTATLSHLTPLPHSFALRACVERAAARRWQQLLLSPASPPPPAPIIEISKVSHEQLARAFEVFQDYARHLETPLPAAAPAPTAASSAAPAPLSSSTGGLLSGLSSSKRNIFLEANVWQDDPCVLHATFEDLLKPRKVDPSYRTKM